MKTTIGRLKQLIKEETGITETVYPPTAEEYAQQLHDEAEARGGQFFLATDSEHWAKYNVHTGEELAKHLAKENYWDAYKEAYGVRPRGANLDDMSIEELESAVESLYDYARDEQERDLEDIERWEKEQRVPEPEEFQTPALTHSPFADLKK